MKISLQMKVGWESWGYSAWRRWWGDFIVAFQCLKGAPMKAGVKSSVKACSDMARGNGYKLKEHRFRRDFWEEAEDGLSLAVSKLWLNRALSNLICWKMFVPTASSVDKIVFKSPFQRIWWVDILYLSSCTK